jgi:hypothetical protein
MTESYVPAFVVAYAERASQDPTNPMSWYARAHEYRTAGDLEAWCRTIEVALSVPHHSPEQCWSRAWARLTRGDWSGWTDYEARALHADDRSPRTTWEDWVRWTHGPWDGNEGLGDKTILVLSEQGMGDNIQMLRYLPLLADRAHEVIVRVYPRLVPFVQCNFGDRVTVIIHGVDKPYAFDRYTNLMSLPHLFEQLPPFVPLRSPRRRPPLSARGRPVRAGICWAGSSYHGNDETRSMPAACIAPLLARTDIEWHTLQVGERAVEADRYPSLVRPWPPLITFGDTADLIAELDMVVAVDTAVGHLAGCLGAPTYLMLPFCSEYRWGLEDRTPWYPSMQLVRQPAAGDWAGAVVRLQQLLDQFVLADEEIVTNDNHSARPHVFSAVR